METVVVALSAMACCVDGLIRTGYEKRRNKTVVWQLAYAPGMELQAQNGFLDEIRGGGAATPK